MSIELKTVITKSQLREFIFLPKKIYSQHANWVPPIYIDEWAFHNPKKNNALSYSEVIRVIAYQDKIAVGRVMGILNKKYNEKHGLKNVSFFNLDIIDDHAVSHALLDFIEQWGREKGMNKVVGPYGLSDKDPQGLQIEGFENLPVIVTPTNPPYLKKLVESEGYQKEVDCISYKLNVPDVIPTVYEKIADRIEKNNDIHLLEFKSKKQLKPHILPALQLMNEAYAHLYGFTQMTESEMKNLADQYLFVLDPEFVKVIQCNGKTVAFGVGMPDISKGIQRAKGNLFPFGFIHILNASRKAKQLNLLLGAVKQSFRGIGLNVLLGKSMLASAHRRGFTTIDSHLILETNKLMRSEFEKVGGVIYKRFRVYQKNL
ncbi:MAG: hypothetical protein JJE09_05375 [Bacteroidia bacterium]|nr:hypothetical protein [Bacteroidia bacterium]